jgi:small subunit ribosomal protein S8
MNVTDPIADMLTRIRNAAAAGLPSVDMPHSKMREAIAQILKKEGFVADFAVTREGLRGTLAVNLKYGGRRRSVIRGLRRISRPGLRRYAGATDLPRVVGGTGIAIVSTSRGVMTDRDARTARVGGEVLCYVW